MIGSTMRAMIMIPLRMNAFKAALLFIAGIPAVLGTDRLPLSKTDSVFLIPRNGWKSEHFKSVSLCIKPAGKGRDQEPNFAFFQDDYHTENALVAVCNRPIEAGEHDIFYFPRQPPLYGDTLVPLGRFRLQTGDRLAVTIPPFFPIMVHAPDSLGQPVERKFVILQGVGKGFERYKDHVVLRRRDDGRIGGPWNLAIPNREYSVELHDERDGLVEKLKIRVSAEDVLRGVIEIPFKNEKPAAK